MQDQEIIDLYNRRDEQAIVQTETKYGSYCMSIAQNILQNMQDSEECVNDTWLHTWNSIPPAQPNNLRTYLGKITRNLSFNRYEMRNRQKRGGGEVIVALDEIGEVAAPDAELASQLEREDFARILNAFLWSLPERDCSIFIRRYYYVESVDEIAERYAMSKAAVFKSLSRARMKLRQALEQEGYTV
ncbi:MAG: RNA polymerase sigma factor [Clostridia bacterium]|nr:RNA polymerase sigma factor [Clostridia bacterium]